jgi:hypothetical protein
MAIILSTLEPAIMQNYGARFEAGVFSILLQIPDILYTLEFATVDGAIDLIAPARSSTVSFAYRSWDLDTARVVPFDVKSLTSGMPRGRSTSSTLKRNAPLPSTLAHAPPTQAVWN